MNPAGEITQLLLRHDVILLTSHIRLDGDAIGSELALWHALRRMGKRAHIVNDSEIPAVYTFLKGTEEVGASPEAMWDDYDLVVVLDTATLARTGGVAKRLPKDIPVIIIDHHVSNEGFGTVNWADPNASSVGEMVYDVICLLGVDVDEPIAEAIATAIITDTGRFMHGNTTARSLRIIAELTERGLDIGTLSTDIYRSCDFAILKLQGKAIATIELVDLPRSKKLACMQLTRRMFDETRTKPIDVQEFVEIPRSIRGVSVAALFTEMQKDGWTKVSLRSNDELNVEQVAKKFGGGGHEQAAGCEVAGKIEQVKEGLIQAVSEAVKGTRKV